MAALIQVVSKSLVRYVKLTQTTVRSCCSSTNMGKSKLVVTESIGNMFLIGINRPEVRNCVNPETGNELVKAFQDFEGNDDLHVAVLYGKGGYFCGGFDLKALSKLDNTSALNFGGNSLPDDIKRPLGPSMMTFSKPVIAAVAGYAVAGGLELALMCDLRVVEESAIMGVFCRRFGVPLLDGGTVRLPHLIGLSRAMDLILTGRPVSASEAKDIGLANRIVPNGSAVGEAVKLAQSLCAFPQECMRTDRRSAYYSSYDAKSMKDAFHYELTTGSEVIAKESVKGAQRFVAGQGKHGSFDGSGKSKL